MLWEPRCTCLGPPRRLQRSRTFGASEECRLARRDCPIPLADHVGHIGKGSWTMSADRLLSPNRTAVLLALLIAGHISIRASEGPCARPMCPATGRCGPACVKPESETAPDAPLAGTPRRLPQPDESPGAQPDRSVCPWRQRQAQAANRAPRTPSDLQPASSVQVEGPRRFPPVPVGGFRTPLEALEALARWRQQASLSNAAGDAAGKSDARTR